MTVAPAREMKTHRVVEPNEVLAWVRAALLPGGNDVQRVGGVVLMPHQQEAVRILRSSIRVYGGAILADPVGTGKTWSALGVASFYERVLVVAPASLRAMWRTALVRANCSGEFVTYESMSRSRPEDAASSFDLVIADEAHHVRNAATRRYRALAALCWGADLLLLSATPIHNRPDELRALVSLFLGSGAWRLTPELLGRLVCRRDEPTDSPLPRASPITWISVPDSNDILRDILDLPPPLVPADGEEAVVLGTYVLLRQWCSSDAALVAALQRRLVSGQAMSHRLSQGQVPKRQELARWMVDSNALQLTFDLKAPDEKPGDVSDLTALLTNHLAAVRRLRDRLKGSMQRDASRAASLLKILPQGSRSVLFTHSADTARMWFARLMHQSRVALLNGHGARIASGRISRDEAVAAFHPRVPLERKPPARGDPMRIDTLVATDVLSEGVGLHDADLVVHLDLPWTVARMEQRVGRLRRIGSPHERILQFAFAPPGAGNNALRLLERLARKARISEVLVGRGHGGLSFGASHGSSPSPSTALDQLVQLSRNWPDQPRQRKYSTTLVSACTSSDPAQAGFVAVTSEGQMLSLVGTTGQTLTTSPYDLLGLFSSVGPSLTPPADDTDNAIALVHDYITTQKAHDELLGGVARQSEVHRKLSRILHSCLRLAPRYERLRLAQVSDLLRDLLSRTRGAGSEHFLENWLAQHARPRLADLEKLAKELERHASATHPNPGESSIKALLLILPQARHQ